MLPRVALEYGHVWCLASARGLGDFALQTRQADVKASSKEVSAVGYVQVHFGVNRQVGRESDLHFTGRKPHRRFETGRPTSGEQLLRIGAGARGARSGKPDVQAAVRAAGRAVPATGSVDFGGVQYFSELGYDGLLAENSPRA
jgi:hypothetical protein